MNGTTPFPVAWFFDTIIGPRDRLWDLHVVKPDAASIANSGQPFASSFTIGRLVSSIDRSSSERCQESTTTSSARTSRGRKFPKGKELYSHRKNSPIECAQGDRPARCPNHFFGVNEPSAVPWW